MELWKILTGTKFINSRNKKEKRIIKEKFKELEKNPYPSNDKLDLKKLQNFSSFRLRIGKYRFIYEVFDNELFIYIYKADSRGDIYK